MTMPGRKSPESGGWVLLKCLPFRHDYDVEDGSQGHGHRKVVCERCGYWKIQKHFGRGVWL